MLIQFSDFEEILCDQIKDCFDKRPCYSKEELYQFFYYALAITFKYYRDNKEAYAKKYKKYRKDNVNYINIVSILNSFYFQKSEFCFTHYGRNQSIEEMKNSFTEILNSKGIFNNSLVSFDETVNTEVCKKVFIIDGFYVNSENKTTFDNNITDKQQKVINNIQNKLNIFFEGTTKYEAIDFISQHIDKLYRPVIDYNRN